MLVVLRPILLSSSPRIREAFDDEHRRGPKSQTGRQKIAPAHLRPLLHQMTPSVA